MSYTMKCSSCWAIIPADASSCPKCGQSFRTTGLSPELSQSTWYVVIGDEQFGPVGLQFIAAEIQKGKVTPKNLVRREGDVNWVPAGKVFKFPEAPQVAQPAVQYAPAVSPNTCPKCGSSRITRLSMYIARNKKKRSGCGIGCLILVLLFIFMPGLCGVVGVGAGLGFGAFVAKFWQWIIIGFLIFIALGIVNYFRFICESCGHKYFPQKGGRALSQEEKRGENLQIAALIMGILALLTVTLPILCFLLVAGAGTCGWFGIKANKVKKGMGLAGLIIAGVALLIMSIVGLASAFSDDGRGAERDAVEESAEEQPAEAKMTPEDFARVQAREAEAKKAAEEARVKAAARAAEVSKEGAARLAESLKTLAATRDKSVDEIENAATNLQTTLSWLAANGVSLPNSVKEMAPTLSNATGGPPDAPSIPVRDKPEFVRPEYSGPIKISGSFKAKYDGGLFGKDGIVVTSGGDYIVVLGAEITFGLFFTSYVHGYGNPTGDTVTLDIGKNGREAMVYEFCDEETYRDEQKEYRAEVQAAKEIFNEQMRVYREEVAADKRTMKEYKIELKAYPKIREAALRELPAAAQKAYDTW